MKATKFVIYTSAVTAHAQSSISNFLGFGVCNATGLLGGLLGRSAQCFNDVRAADLPDMVDLRDVSVPVPDANQSDNPLLASAWPIRRPCTQNTTHQFCIFSNPAFAHGRGITVFTTAETAAEMARAAVFRDPDVVDGAEALNIDESDSWEIRPAPGKGLGVFATRDIQLGEVVMSTSPTTVTDYRALASIPPEQFLSMQGDGVAFLPTATRSKFLNLSTQDGAERTYEHKVHQIVVTNAFEVVGEGVVETADSFNMMFPESARMNHACRPSVEYHFDPVTFTQKAIAIRDIRIGEELTITYINGVDTAETRRMALQHTWGFHCTCSACAQNALQKAASDERVRQIWEIRRQLRDFSAGSGATPSMAELLISLYRQEGLHTWLHEAYTFAAIEHAGVADAWQATRYAHLSIQYGLASNGPEHADVREMMSLARDPWAHWSWMLRTARRMNWSSAASAAAVADSEQQQQQQQKPLGSDQK